MTEPGETDGYSAVDHLEAIRRHVPQVCVHDVLLNTESIPHNLIDQYALEGATPVPPSHPERRLPPGGATAPCTWSKDSPRPGQTRACARQSRSTAGGSPRCLVVPRQPWTTQRR
jgi:hypothetical protein